MATINTSCKKCLFAKRDENGVQNGCELGRLEIYKKRNLAVLEGDSYKIDTLCIACRASDQFSMSAKSIRESLKISTIFIINGFEKNYWPLLKKVLNQKLMPFKVIVCIKEIEAGISEKYTEYLKYFNNKNSNLLIKKYHDKDVDFYSTVNDCVSRYGIDFYTILDPDSNLKDDYLEKIDHIYTDKLEPVVAILSDEEYKNTFSTTLHYMLGGNSYDKTLKEKLLSLDKKLVAEGNIWTESML